MEASVEVVNYASMGIDGSFRRRSDLRGKFHGSHHCCFHGGMSFHGGSGSFHEQSGGSFHVLAWKSKFTSTSVEASIYFKEKECLNVFCFFLVFKHAFRYVYTEYFCIANNHSCSPLPSKNVCFHFFSTPFLFHFITSLPRSLQKLLASLLWHCRRGGGEAAYSLVYTYILGSSSSSQWVVCTTPPIAVPCRVGWQKQVALRYIREATITCARSTRGRARVRTRRAHNYLAAGWKSSIETAVATSKACFVELLDRTISRLLTIKAISQLSGCSRQVG